MENLERTARKLVADRGLLAEKEKEKGSKNQARPKGGKGKTSAGERRKKLKIWKIAEVFR